MYSLLFCRKLSTIPIDEQKDLTDPVELIIPLWYELSRS